MTEWIFPINPTAASRPRVSFKGGHAYFTGPYKRFREEMVDLVPTVIGDHVPFTGDIAVTVEFMAKRPKTTILSSPRGDIDNYLKALFDALNAKAFEDDKQIVIVHARKSWTPSNEDEGYIKVSITETS